MAYIVYVRHVFTHEVEISPIIVRTIHVQLVQVEDNFDHPIVLAENQEENQQSSNEIPHMRIIGLWSDIVIYLDYIQDTPFICSMNSSNVIVTKYVLNPNVAHDFQIFQSYWKGNDSFAKGTQVYTDEEERASTINYL